MNEGDGVGRSAEPPGRGRAAVVRSAAPDGTIDVRRLEPSERWQRWVEYLWIVRWDLATPMVQPVIPQPVIHLAAEVWPLGPDGSPRLLVHGVSRSGFRRRLTGQGHVLGAAFRPGGFGALLGGPLSSIADTVTPLADLAGPDDAPAATRILQPTASDDDMVAALEVHLDRLDDGRLDDDAAATVREMERIMGLAESDRSITSADALAERSGVGLRTLQRLFGEHVGIGPKWVVRRFRLLDAAAAAHDGRTDWATLAVELGFSDQSHLTRMFTAVVGTPPATYRRRLDDASG